MTSGNAGTNPLAPCCLREMACVLLVATVAGCGATRSRAGAASSQRGDSASARAAAEPADLEQDRAAIRAMAGEYEVTFEFRETVSFQEDYRPREPFRTGGHEVVRVIEDSGDVIRLQHILVVGQEDEKRAVKHWRQDWIYEPDSMLVYIGGNAWKRRDLTEEEADGKWAQIVYQVDDSPRYGALAEWTHEHGISEWEPPAEWRPLPRRDATERDDYHAIDGVNRHTITPFGWVHEQDNVKLVLGGGDPRALVREIGVNTYRRSDDVAAGVADRYWSATREFWAGVRAEWRGIAAENRAFGLTVRGEPAPLYRKLLGLADEVKEGTTPTERALEEARSVIDRYTTTEVGTLAERLGR